METRQNCRLSNEIGYFLQSQRKHDYWHCVSDFVIASAVPTVTGWIEISFTTLLL